MRSEQPAPETQTTRRTFLDWFLATSIGATIVAAVYPLTRFVLPPRTAEAATASVTLPFGASDVAPNSGQLFKFGSRPGLLIRTPDGELRAFDAVCTHLQCTVEYRSDFGHIWCACHDGHYDLGGTNIAGPPPRPLERFALNALGDQLFVSKTS